MKTPPIFLKDLQFASGQQRFSGRTPKHLAGRCLVDALEFLRIDPRWPARFGQLLNAHAIRLCWQYVKALDHDEMKARIQNLIESAYVHILDKRNPDIPPFGDDFWDWAYILDAQLTVVEACGSKERKKTLSSDVQTFYQEVKARLDDGLALDREGEWFGPATPTAAYRVLSRAKSEIDDTEFDKCLKQLKKLALTPIDRGKYLGRVVRPDYHQWHFGQVAAEFPKKAKHLKKDLATLRFIEKMTEKTTRAYALSRVLQGAAALKDSQTVKKALSLLYECESQSRPLGTGMVGDHVKASVNVLEAVWPTLSRADREEVKDMLDALLAALKRANRVGILVAVDIERTACIEQFKIDGALVTEEADVVNVDHPNYRVAIVSGKSLVGATEATGRLINEHRVTSAILVGIAGSLGHTVDGQFKGPEIGDVVIGTGSAAYRVREKVRESVTDAPVPWDKSTWGVVPSDPTLFAMAHRLGQDLKTMRVHEGLVVTGNGIKDNPQEKEAVREKWPGGLAVAEEGFALTLGCLQHHVPQIELRGISDLAQGDKALQALDRVKEDQQQELAAKNAAKLAVALVNSLSQMW